MGAPVYWSLATGGGLISCAPKGPELMGAIWGSGRIGIGMTGAGAGAGRSWGAGSGRAAGSGSGRAHRGQGGGRGRGALSEQDLHPVGPVDDAVGGLALHVEDEPGHLRGIGAELPDPRELDPVRVHFDLAGLGRAQDFGEVDHQAARVAQEEVLVPETAVGLDVDGEAAMLGGRAHRQDLRGPRRVGRDLWLDRARQLGPGRLGGLRRRGLRDRSGRRRRGAAGLAGA